MSENSGELCQSQEGFSKHLLSSATVKVMCPHLVPGLELKRMDMGARLLPLTKCLTIIQLLLQFPHL